ncbi:hypothetical protein B0H17DRAFT_1193670 [Mycena rosella]|uniref:Uncharacterized protein n=1 Tax=Mycena rosella TaxID=1033263 RepID=A0AAD7M7C1_MYCRO|nr:hypothetical protein B0H17DRAFT_1193670 [Mycena rosella]
MPRRPGILRPVLALPAGDNDDDENHISSHYHHRLRFREDHDARTKMCGRLGTPGSLARRVLVIIVRPSRRLFLGADRRTTPTRHPTPTGTSSAFGICTPHAGKAPLSFTSPLLFSFLSYHCDSYPRRRGTRASPSILVLPRPRYPPHLPIYCVPSSAPALVPCRWSTAAPSTPCSSRLARSRSHDFY